MDRPRPDGSVTIAQVAFVMTLAAAACAVDPGPVDRAVTERFDARRLAWQGDFDAAEELLRSARETHADSTLAAGHLDVALGDVLLRRGVHDRILRPEARTLYEHAIEVASRAQDQQLRADATHGLGHYAYRSGPETWDDALEHFERALAITTGISDTTGMARAHFRIGLVHQRMARFDDADPHFETSIELARAILSDYLIGENERHIGFQRYLGGDHAGALPHFEASFEARRKAGYLDGAMFAQITVGWALIQLGRDADAIAPLEEALSKAKELESPEAQLRAHNELATAFGNLGEVEKAREHAAEVTRIREEMGWADPASSEPAGPPDEREPASEVDA